MKAKRNLLIGLIVVLVILSLGAVAAQQIGKAASESASDDSTVLMTNFSSSSDIDSFGYTYNGQSLTFEKREEVVQSDSSQPTDDSAASSESDSSSSTASGDTSADTSTSATTDSEPETETVWYIADDPEYKINQTTINSMLTGLATMQASRELTQSSEDFGLDNPTLTIWVTANGETTKWICGATNSMTNTVYVQEEGKDSVYLVDSSRLTTFQKTKTDLMDTTSSAS